MSINELVRGSIPFNILKEGFVMRKELKWRWLFFVVGIAVMSFGVAMTIKGKVVGTAPWDVLHIGLFQRLGLSVGSWGIILGLCIILSTSLILKEWPKITTWINMLLCGLFIDLFNWLLPTTDVLIYEIAYFIFGVIILGVGCALYISPNLGAGPRDTIMILIVEKLGGSIRMARLTMESVAAIIGWLLGGPVGIGTIIIALCSGYIIQAALPYFQRLLEKKIAGPEYDKISSKHTKPLAKEA